MAEKRKYLTKNKQLIGIGAIGLVLLCLFVLSRTNNLQKDTINKFKTTVPTTTVNSVSPIPTNQTTTTPANYPPGPIILTFKKEITKNQAENFLTGLKLDYKLISTTPPLVYEVKVIKDQEQFWIDKLYTYSEVSSVYINYQNTIQD